MSLSQRDLRRTIVVKCPKEISVTTMHLEKDQIDLLKKNAYDSLDSFLQSYPYQGEAPGLWAVTRGYYSLLDHHYPTGYDQIDRVDNKGRSALMIGVINQRHDIVEKLIH